MVIAIVLFILLMIIGFICCCVSENEKEKHRQENLQIKRDLVDAIKSLKKNN